MREMTVHREWGDLTFSYDPNFLDEDFEKEIFEFAKTIVKPQDTILDIGAHQGSYSTFFGWLANQGQVYAFEPHPVNYKYLLMNTLGYTNVRSINKAVGDSNGKKTLMTWDADIEGTTGRHSFSEMGGTIPMEVDVVTIDTFVKENNMRVDLIKMDVEMWEWEVIQGAKDTISSQRPKMIIEIHGSDWFNRKINPMLPRIEKYFDSLNMPYVLIPGSVSFDSQMEKVPYTCTKCGHAVTLGVIQKKTHTGIFMVVNC
jgi:FkbM family methyltransferase